MKNQLPLGVVIGAIAAVLAVAGAIYYFVTKTPEPDKTTATDASKGPPGMPSSVQAEFAKRMGGGVPTGPGVKPGGVPGGAPMMTGPGAGAGK